MTVKVLTTKVFRRFYASYSPQGQVIKTFIKKFMDTSSVDIWQ